MDSKLSPKVKGFIAEYLEHQNATAAVERAGYSDPNYGHQLLTNPEVVQAIAEQQKAFTVRTLSSADEVLEQMWQLATSWEKLGKNGIEITAISREHMYEAMMKRLGSADR